MKLNNNFKKKFIKAKKHELFMLDSGIFLIIIVLGTGIVFDDDKYSGIWQLFLLGLSGGYFHSAFIIGDRKDD